MGVSVERRGSPRVAYSGITFLTYGRAELPCIATDISELGIQVIPQRHTAVRPGSALRLAFTLPHSREWLQIKGTVVRRVRINHRTTLGVKFYDVPPEARENLRSFVYEQKAHHSAVKPPPPPDVAAPPPVVIQSLDDNTWDKHRSSKDEFLGALLSDDDADGGETEVGGRLPSDFVDTAVTLDQDHLSEEVTAQTVIEGPKARSKIPDTKVIPKRTINGLLSETREPEKN